MYHTGLASIAFRHLSVEEVIAVAKNAGLEYIEWGSDVHAPKDDLENLDRIRELTLAAGLRCSSYGTYFRIDKDEPQQIMGYIEAARRLGVDIIRIWCPGNPAVLTAEEKQQLYTVCRTLAAIAQEQGVTLCAECHNGNLTEDAQSSLEFMEAVNSPAFRMYWQANENFTAEENLAFAQAVAPYVTNIHVYNWHGRVRFPLAEDRDAWPPYIRALGKDRIFLLEHMPNDDEGLLPQEADSLRQILASV